MSEEHGAELHKLDLSAFKKRNSAILRDLEEQEEERDTLWAALQKAREDGERLREALKEEEEGGPVVSAEDPNEEVAPTSAELMAMITEKEESLPQVVLPSRFASCRTPVKKEENPAVLASGFICPTCWMRAPTAEVLRKHDEDVHQSHLEKATNRILDNTGALGNMTRVAVRKIRRSMSLAPRAAPTQENNNETSLLTATRQAAFTPAAQPPHRQSRRSSLPPPSTSAAGTKLFQIYGARAHWRRHVIV